MARHGPLVCSVGTGNREPRGTQRSTAIRGGPFRRCRGVYTREQTPFMAGLSYRRERKSPCFPRSSSSFFLWVLGLVTSYTFGGLVHILLVVAIIVVLLRVIQGRNPLRG